MLKQIVIILLFVYSVNIYCEDSYEKRVTEASSAIKSGDYKKGEEIYSKLYEKYQTTEFILNYSNVLAWQKRYNEALKIIENARVGDSETEAQRAKIYFWKGDNKKAEEIYSVLEKKGYNTGENGKNVKKIFEEKEEEKRYKLKSGVYYDNEKKDMMELVYSFEYKYNEKSTVVLTIEDWENNNNLVKQIELYYGNWYFLAASSNTLNRALQAEYTWKIFKAGIKEIDGSYIYKAGIENSISKFYLLNEVNFIKAENTYYKSKMKYEKSLETTAYYDFKDLMTLEMKGRVPIYRGTYVWGGFQRDFKADKTLYIVEIEYQF